MSDSFYKGKKIIITGGLGFLGSNLAQRLISSQPGKIVLLDAMLPLYGGNFKNIENIRELVVTKEADIRNADVLQEIIPETDILFHFASQTSHVDSMADPFLDVDINCRGNITLLEACRSLAPNVRIVYIGTRSQYGPAQYVPVDESHPRNPHTTLQSYSQPPCAMSRQTMSIK